MHHHRILSSVCTKAHYVLIGEYLPACLYLKILPDCEWNYYYTVCLKTLRIIIIIIIIIKNNIKWEVKARHSRLL